MDFFFYFHLPTLLLGGSNVKRDSEPILTLLKFRSAVSRWRSPICPTRLLIVAGIHTPTVWVTCCGRQDDTMSMCIFWMGILYPTVLNQKWWWVYMHCMEIPSGFGPLSVKVGFGRSVIQWLTGWTAANCWSEIWSGSPLLLYYTHSGFGSPQIPKTLCAVNPFLPRARRRRDGDGGWGNPIVFYDHRPSNKPLQTVFIFKIVI